MQAFFDREVLGSFINNEFVASKKTRPTVLYSSVTKDPWKKMHLATAKEISQAIKSAQKAFLHLKKTTAYQRAEVLMHVADKLQELKDPIARIITTEMGKTFKEAKGEVDYATSYFRWYAGEAIRVFGYMVPSSVPEKEIRVYHEPVGICAFITAWNFPLAIPARKIAAAIAAGCPVIIKPSPETPCNMLLLAAIFQKIGVEKGVFSVLVGDEKMIGKKLLEENTIRKISFTGSTRVGQILYAACAPTIKKATMELGGQAPALVFDDADLEKTTDEILKAKFRTNGQTCVAANRILVQKKIYSQFVDLILKKIKKLKVGNPFVKEVEISNVLHPLSVARVQQHVKDAKAKGARVLLQGKTPANPCILEGCKDNMLVFQEETFGPIVAIGSFVKDEEAITRANNTPFGLAAYMFSRSPDRIKKVAAALEFGVVGVNDGLPNTPQAPFGGVKHSGFGREGGPHAIYEYLTEKLVSQRF